MGTKTNHLPRIDSIWAALSVDEDGDEGVVAAPLPGYPDLHAVPLIASDEARLKDFVIPMATLVSRLMKKKVRIVRFHTREVITELGGGS